MHVQPTPALLQRAAVHVRLLARKQQAVHHAREHAAVLAAAQKQHPAARRGGGGGQQAQLGGAEPLQLAGGGEEARLGCGRAGQGGPHATLARTARLLRQLPGAVEPVLRRRGGVQAARQLGGRRLRAARLQRLRPHLSVVWRSLAGAAQEELGDVERVADRAAQRGAEAEPAGARAFLVRCVKQAPVLARQLHVQRVAVPPLGQLCGGEAGREGDGD